MGLEKIDYNFFLGWTPCESKKAIHTYFYFNCSLLLQIWLGMECQNRSYYQCCFCHKGDFLMTQYQLIGLSMAFFVRWVIWSIVDKVQAALYPLSGSSSGSDILSTPNQDVIIAADDFQWTEMKLYWFCKQLLERQLDVALVMYECLPL